MITFDRHWCMPSKYTFSIPYYTTYCLCLYDKMLIGWGIKDTIVSTYQIDDYDEIMLYVHENFRRLGIGTSIVQKLRRENKKTLVNCIDKQATLFFKSIDGKNSKSDERFLEESKCG